MANVPALLSSLTLRYLLALTVVGSLATAAFLSLHKVILRHENEAAVVNIAGRQRMFSQRITLAASQLALADDPAERQRWRGDLLVTLDLMERSHRALTQGDPALGIPPALAASIGGMYADGPLAVSRQVTDFLADGRRLAASPAADRGDPIYRRILERSPAVLSGLDDVVSRYQADVERRVRRLERMEIAVWLVTLAALVLEALLIFRPMVRRVRRSLEEEEEKLAAAEQQAISDQRRTEALIDTIADAVIIVDQDGLIQTFSPSAERMFGRRRAEILGQSFGVLMPEPHRRRHGEILARYLQGAIPPLGASLEVAGQRSDGTIFPAELALGEWRDGARRFVTAVIRDITQRRAFEEQMRRAQKMEVVGQLSGGVAHDFNNLLGIICGNLEILETRLRDDPKLMRRLAVAQHAASRGADLTRKLLSYSGGRASQPAVVDLNMLIRASSGLLDRLQADRVDVTLALAADLVPVCVDPGEFEDVLLNLALNARDAMPEGGRLRIETANLGGGRGGVVVAVSDTGMGIPPELQAKIFEPFFTSKPPGKGTGLGLATVDRFVRRSGGTIEVTSRPGQGTAFRILLPAAAPDAAAGRTGETAAPRGGSETLLVVDDEADLLAVACSQLESLGYRCLPAQDGPDAMRILAAEPSIRLLVTDVIMPGAFDGVELARRALSARPDLKILFSTGFAGRTAEQIENLVPRAGLIGKPYRRDDLADKVRALLDGDPVTAG